MEGHNLEEVKTKSCLEGGYLFVVDNLLVLNLEPEDFHLVAFVLGHKK